MSPDARSHRAEAPSALPPGTRLAEFEVLSLLGVGGFGIVYLAFDHALEREVAVKEYMPASLAGRTATMHVSIRSHSDAETFALGLKSFVNEAKLLARFDHPSLLKVLRFWEANGTAYMAMPVLRGRTVKEARAELGGAPTEAWLRELLEPLLGAIERLHDAGVFHRDIAPDNIQIEPDGRPVLLDFGAARRVISDKTQTLTAILKPAYAPIEQYAEVGAVKQGPWTDLYALGATLHYLLVGRPPAPATARTVHDEASVLTVENLPGCSAEFLHIVDWMLAPRPADRPQSVAALREALAGQRKAPRRDLAAPHSPWERTAVLPPTPGVEIPLELDDMATQMLAPNTGPGATDLVLPDLVATESSIVAPAGTTRQPPRAPASTPDIRVEPDLSAPSVAAGLATPIAPQRRSMLLPAALGLVALAVVAAGAMFWPRSPAGPVAAQSAASAPEVAAAASGSPPRGASDRPESAVATVVVPAAQVARPLVADARPSAAAAEPGAASAAALAIAASAPAPAAHQASQSHAGTALATPAASAPAAVPQKPAPGPEARCAGRSPVAFYECMESQCARGEFQNHLDCRNWRKEATKR